MSTHPEDRMLPEHLVEAAHRHRLRHRRVAIIVRHAERHPVVELVRHEEALLTERGHRQAHEAGTRLRRLHERLVVHHSPVARCRETAEGIARGFGDNARVMGPEEGFGAPFVLDRERAFSLVTERGGVFMREWFDGKLPPDVFLARPDAAQTQLQAIERSLRADAITVCVTHDWNVALMKEHWLALSPERGWPQFLDGIVYARDDEGAVVEIDGRVARLPDPR